MKIGVISDVHSNLPALESVLEGMGKEDIELLVCLGDIVGYGPFPNKTIEALQETETKKICVKGNHDERVLGGKTARFSPDALKAAEWTKENIRDESLNFLEKLEEYKAVDIKGKGLFLAHGSPRDPLNEYIGEKTEDEVLDGFLEETQTDVILLGHTHIPFRRETKKGLIANPGSVGQPRDGDSRASYAVFDTENMTVDHRRTEYDIEKVTAAIRQTKLPDSLAERLYRGN
ncbi:MAG: metallophosphoesterase family protein [Candidatus Aenigmatarchaeota archaeon]